MTVKDRISARKEFLPATSEQERNSFKEQERNSFKEEEEEEEEVMKVADNEDNNPKESAFPYILFWIVSSISLILFNKSILAYYHFPYPMFLTGWHMLFATVATQILSRTTSMLPGVAQKKVSMQTVVRKFTIIAFLYSISLIFANKTYLYLPVSYIQMLKAFTPVCVLIVSLICGQQKGSWLEGGIVVIISIGVAITSVGEMNFSAIGATYQLISIACESTRLVLINLVIKDLKLDPLSTLYYLAPLCFIFISTAFWMFEADTFDLNVLHNHTLLALLVLNGLIAFSLNIAAVLLMGKASALILALSGILKDIMLVGMSVAMFGSEVTAIQVGGYSVALFGLQLHKEYKKDPTTAYDRLKITLGVKNEYEKIDKHEKTEKTPNSA